MLATNQAQIIHHALCMTWVFLRKKYFSATWNIMFPFYSVRLFINAIIVQYYLKPTYASESKITE